MAVGTPAISKRDLQNLVLLRQMYEQNPDAFNREELAYLNEVGSMYGIDFPVHTSLKTAIGNLAFNIADTLLFGLLPDSMARDLFGAPMTKTEGALARLGDLIGVVGAFMGTGPLAARLGLAATRGGTSALSRLATRTGIKAGTRAAETATSVLSKAGESVPQGLSAYTDLLDTARRLLRNAGSPDALKTLAGLEALEAQRKLASLAASGASRVGALAAAGAGSKAAQYTLGTLLALSALD